MMKDPTPPAIAPMPVTEAIVDFGNMSPTVEKMLALHAWCPAAARPMRIAGNHTEMPASGCVTSAASGKNAKMSIARIRHMYGFPPKKPFSMKIVGSLQP